MSSPYRFVLEPDLSDNPHFQDLVARWEERKHGRALPLRRDVDPIELKGHLGSLNIIECPPDLTDFRYRLIGTRIAQAYGRDSTGKTVRELYSDSDPEYCDFLLDVYRTVATQGAIARVTATLRPVDRAYRSADSLLLPLDRGDGSVGFILNEVLFH